jgi:transcriptional regulator of acetoin/glycerol metabolism
MADNGATRPGSPDLTLRRVLDRLEHAGGDVGPLRDDILASWQRCVQAGLQPDQFEVPYDPDVDDHGRLSWAAGSIIDRVGDDLAGAPVGLLLTDQRGQIVARRAGEQGVVRLLDRIRLAPGFLYGEALIGTNAIGTAIARGGPSVVLGHEHFADAMISVACTAMPVTDPATGRVIGVVDLTCPAAEASPLMLPLVKRAVWELEQRLLQDVSLDERVLQEHFLRVRRRARGPLALVNERTMLVNSPAAAILQSSDRAMLWDRAARALQGDQQGSSEIPLASGRVVEVNCEPVLDGARVVGALVRLEPASAQDRGASGRHRGLSTPRYGWSSLTGTERLVADLVAEGRTNAEAAAHLFLSPHTIDFHLRQVFRKLDVGSRVELTRLVLTRAGQPVGA